MKRNTIFIAAFVAVLAGLEPTVSRAQSASISEGSSWGSFNNAGPNDNFNGGGSWGNFNNAGPGDNFNGGGSWGNFNNADPDDNTGGSGSWGNFNNTSPDAGIGGGLALLTVAGFGYACAKRRKAKKQELH